MKSNTGAELPPPSLDDLVTSEYLVEKFGVTVRTVDRWNAEGIIKKHYFPFLKKPMFDKREIEALRMGDGEPRKGPKSKLGV